MKQLLHERCPVDQYVVDLQTLACRLILRFPQFLTSVGGWGNSFPFFKVTKFLSLYQSTCCVIIWHFTTVPKYEPQRYSGGVMRKRRGLPNAYDFLFINKDHNNHSVLLTNCSCNNRSILAIASELPC